jgi:DNA-binding NarL/FixJ family response regulator
MIETATRRPIRIFVVDDHEMVRRGVRDLAAELEEIEVVGDADRASTALEGIARTEPDVALLDVRLPDENGIELCREVRSQHPGVRCLMFTSYSDDEALLNAIMAGASGYLLKFTSGDELVEAIQTVAAGGSLIDRGAMQAAVAKMSRPSTKEALPLSPQQERVLELIVDGLTNREIGEKLNLAEKTVKNYVSAILDKLGVRSRTQAAVYRATDPERGKPEATPPA